MQLQIFRNKKHIKFQIQRKYKESGKFSPFVSTLSSFHCYTDKR
nr:MAG TPA: hypothetical protein [Caudoviricetes sp.]